MTNQVISLSRKQLSTFLPTQESVRAFEYLFKIASDLNPQNYDNIVAQVDALSDQVATLQSQIDSLIIANQSAATQLDELEKMLNERGVR